MLMMILLMVTLVGVLVMVMIVVVMRSGSSGDRKDGEGDDCASGGEEEDTLSAGNLINNLALITQLPPYLFPSLLFLCHPYLLYHCSYTHYPPSLSPILFSQSKVPCD